jgi:multidrug efflux pump subunit AcrA (membrane-fusion protein)
MSPSSPDNNLLPDVSIFYGRSREQETLKQWIVKERCQAIAIVGITGIGKTSLTAKVVQSLDNEFDRTIWRSLRYVKSFTQLLRELIKSLSNGKDDRSINNIDSGLSKLIGYLRASRCLIVLDDWQLVFRRETNSNFKDREYYKELFKRVGTIQHQSCLIINSTEKFEAIGLLEGKVVRCLSLQGLGNSAKAIFQNKGLQEEQLWQQLISNYRGNPQQLKVVTNIIKEVFGGKVSQFLQQKTFLNVVVDKTTEQQLDEQFDRLSTLEKEVLQVLASAGKALSVEQLRKAISFDVYSSDLTQAIASLSRRSLLEIINDRDKQLFSLQPMVMKYIVREQLPETIIPSHLNNSSQSQNLSAKEAKQKPKQTPHNTPVANDNPSKIANSQQNLIFLQSQQPSVLPPQHSSQQATGSPSANPSQGNREARTESDRTPPPASQQAVVLFTELPSPSINPHHSDRIPPQPQQPDPRMTPPSPSINPHHGDRIPPQPQQPDPRMTPPSPSINPHHGDRIPPQPQQTDPRMTPPPSPSVYPHHSDRVVPSPQQPDPRMTPPPSPPVHPHHEDITVPAQSQHPAVLFNEPPTQRMSGFQPSPSPAVNPHHGDPTLPISSNPPQPDRRLAESQPPSSSAFNSESPTSIVPSSRSQPSPVVDRNTPTTIVEPQQPQTPSLNVLPPDSANIFPIPPNLNSIGENDFLPPISRWTKLGGMFIVGAVGIGFIVSAFTPYNVTVKAQAKVRPTGELRIVEAQTEGRIVEIKVKENQSVKKREVIAIIDTSRFQTQKKQLIADIEQSVLQSSRIDAQIQAHNRQILAETEQINRTIKAAQAELKVARSKQARYEQVASSGALSQNQVEEAQLAVKQQEQTLAAQNASGTATLAGLSRDKEGLNQQKIEVEKKLQRDRSELQQVEKELKQGAIVAPVQGTLFQLRIRNPGQTVKPGDRIAQIAPSDNFMAIEGIVSSQDISKIKTGQKTQVRISACPYPDYGTLKGKVQNISPDVVSLDNNSPSAGAAKSSQEGYKVTIEPESLVLKQRNKQCNLQVGMEGKADIMTSEETVLQFLLRKAKLMADF